ncbi:hypothetical protein Lfu02_15310 [Longispora fulva]|uniref:GNAT superfamily N-acetyltransferase n=1 Tax=Longispora fulva TaxID=619741 RepID=A0A8J7GWX8_9ACTN|nr:GNAT family N-acetyltransferase [Longispora fulva]MBG6140459.1 GNAT superfamily N-acetyltransferase [Longispora fulva]GIG57159.1 hypothetical protein Lfu02_15310 [Longispora fulva]
MADPSLTLARYAAEDALNLRDVLEDMYEATHLDVADNPFYSREQFWRRLVDWYAPAPGFALVVASLDGEPVGFAFGCTRPADRAAGLWEQVSASEADIEIPASPQPVFVFNELAVRPTAQRHGVGRALHDELLRDRPELIATLTVRPNNPARGFYGHWGWAKVAEVVNTGFPVFEQLVLDLHHRPEPARLELDLRRYGAAGALALREEILNVYVTSHADMQHDPWFGPEAFWDRLETLYAPGRDFELVAGWRDGTLVGYAFGSPRDRDLADLWAEIRDANLPVEFPASHGPVYIFREFAVHPDHQKRGYGKQIHDELLRTRPEAAANLLVRPDNPARAAYTRWGWLQFGTKQPFSDSPVMDNMVKPLP